MVHRISGESDEWIERMVYRISGESDERIERMVYRTSDQIYYFFFRFSFHFRAPSLYMNLDLK